MVMINEREGEEPQFAGQEILKKYLTSEFK